ncbi:MAG: hypothetical protein ACEPOW_09295 [Bacteroidales bacterium]
MEHPDIGNIRETFVMSQLQNCNYNVAYSKETNFYVEETYSFEIGGKNKKKKQI